MQKALMTQGSKKQLRKTKSIRFVLLRPDIGLYIYKEELLTDRQTENNRRQSKSN